MFARIMAVVMAAILITAVCLSGIWWITLRCPVKQTLPLQDIMSYLIR